MNPCGTCFFSFPPSSPSSSFSFFLLVSAYVCPSDLTRKAGIICLFICLFAILVNHWNREREREREREQKKPLTNECMAKESRK